MTERPGKDDPNWWRFGEVEDTLRKAERSFAESERRRAARDQLRDSGKGPFYSFQAKPDAQAETTLFDSDDQDTQERAQPAPGFPGAISAAMQAGYDEAKEGETITKPYEAHPGIWVIPVRSRLDGRQVYGAAGLAWIYSYETPLIVVRDTPAQAVDAWIETRCLRSDILRRAQVGSAASAAAVDSTDDSGSNSARSARAYASKDEGCDPHLRPVDSSVHIHRSRFEWLGWLVFGLATGGWIGYVVSTLR